MRMNANLSRPLAALLTLLALGCAPARDPRIESLYQGQAIVTGQDERSRPRGIVEAFEDVLVKVSGDPRLIDDPRLGAVAAQAASAVTEFSYRDRMEGIPVHDEQGTRDRPYDLTVQFEPARIDAVLRSLGREPWLAPRPRLGVFLGVRIGTTAYLLANAGERGFDQRNALLDAGARRGIPVALPGPADLAAAGLRVDTLGAAGLSSLDARAKAIGADRALAGQIVWSQEPPGWDAAWRMTAMGSEHLWQDRAATFDEAFRRALGTAAQLLSGTGP